MSYNPYQTNQSVSGTVDIGIASGSVASHIKSGSVVAVLGGNTSVVVSNFPTNQNVSGSVIAQIASSVLTVTSGTVVATQIAGSVLAVSGSFTAPANQSVSGALFISGSVLSQQTGTVISSVVSSIPSSMLVGASAYGVFPVVQSGAWTASVVGNVGQVGTKITSVISSTPSSMLVGASIIGLTPVTAVITGNPSISGTVNIGVIPGSVVAFEGAGWSGSVATHIKSGSVIAVLGGNTSVLAIQSGAWSASMVGATYAEDAAHTSGNIGVFSLRIRNDTMSSITSADGDYSADAVGPVGETITANAPINKWVQGVASCAGGVLQPIIAAQGASIFTYITGLQAANFSGTSVLVALFGATSSIVGYTIAPASGGSNIIYPNGLKTNANGAFSASVSGAGLVYISAQGFISKT